MSAWRTQIYEDQFAPLPRWGSLSAAQRYARYDFMLDTQTRSMLSEAAAAFIYRKHKLFIGGEWTDSISAREMEVIDSATGALLTHCALSDTKDVDRAVASARKALEGLWSKMTGIERGKLISRFANRLEELADELAGIESIDCGRPITYARHVDIPLMLNTYRYMAGWAGKVNGETVDVAAPGEYHAFTMREPVGVVAQIVPWNFPLVLTSYKLAPSLAAGCTAIIKPSEQASLSLLRLAEVAEEVGFPPGVINVVTGYGDTVGAALAAHPDVDKFAFTGSARVGRLIAQSATSNLKRVTLEPGGKAPMIVLPDADLEKVIPSFASAAFFYQRQVCTSGSRRYVHKSIHDQVLDGIREEATKSKMGHSLSADATLGPLISLNRLERISHSSAPTAVRLGDGCSYHPKLVFHVFGALAEFERNLIRERTIAGLKAAGAKKGASKSFPTRSLRQLPHCSKRLKSRNAHRQSHFPRHRHHRLSDE
jgi:phenylacetaldehyde dehydrogenase